MPDVWLPGAYRDPGQNAGYNSGRNAMHRAVAHYTVGADSRGIGKRGHFHFLVHQSPDRENGCTQYAEIDAKTWHGFKAGHYDANSAGPGVEFERRVIGGLNNEGLSEAEPLTQNQIEWGGRIIEFCAEWGIPIELYNGPRYEYGNWNGWINHQALDSDRSDGLLRAEWDAMIGGGTSQADLEAWLRYLELMNSGRHDMLTSCVGPDGKMYLFCVGNDSAVWFISAGEDGRWGGWTSLEGQVRKEPSKV